jgi:hypothetical protein
MVRALAMPEAVVTHTLQLLTRVVDPASIGTLEVAFHRNTWGALLDRIDHYTTHCRTNPTGLLMNTSVACHVGPSS